MKAWERSERPDVQKIPPKAIAPATGLALVRKFFNIKFATQRKFWQAFGRRRPAVCQFSLTGEPDEHWFVIVDDSGGRIELGRHGSPDVTWFSDQATFLKVMVGQDVDPSLIRFEGDRSLLVAFLEASDS